jgi:hypothetical protein
LRILFLCRFLASSEYALQRGISEARTVQNVARMKFVVIIATIKKVL